MNFFKRYKVSILLTIGIFLLISGVTAYLYENRIRNHTIQLEERSLSSVVDIGFFEGLKPNMGKSKVITILGETTRIFIEEEDEYREEMWEWGRPAGIMNYYFNPDADDGGQGSSEFLPNNLLIDDLFMIPLPFIIESDKKHKINVIGHDKNPYLSIRTYGRVVDQINYFNSSDNDDKGNL